MKLAWFVLGAMMIGVSFTLAVNFYADGLSTYNVEAETESSFGRVTDGLKTVYEYQDSMKAQIQGGPVSSDSALDEMIQGGYTGIRINPFLAVTQAANTTGILAEEIEYIDPLVVGSGVAILTTLVLFTIISLIFRFRAN